MDIGAWWLGVAEGMKVHGSFATRHYAWARLGAEPSIGLERLVAVLDDPAEDPVALEIRRAAPIVAVELTVRGEDVPEDLVSALEMIALDDNDPVARGLARRALVVGELTDHPMALLGSPDVAVDGEQALGTLGFDHTHVLVHFLLTIPDALDDRRAMASVLEGVLRVALLDANEFRWMRALRTRRPSASRADLPTHRARRREAGRPSCLEPSTAARPLPSSGCCLSMAMLECAEPLHTPCRVRTCEPSTGCSRCSPRC